MIAANLLILNHLLADSSSAAAGDNPLGSQVVMIPLMIALFYLLAIRPQQQQRKELLARIAAIQQGDKVITQAGIHGIIHNVREKTVVIKVADGVMIEFDKAAIATILKKDA